MLDTDAAPAVPWVDVAPDWLGEPWPSNLTRSDQGVMELAGVPLTELAERFGTPVYLLDSADFLNRAARFREAFDAAFTAIGSKCHFFYASKANLNKTIARWALESGFGVDTASAGELAIALAAGVPADKIGFHGNNKSRAELEQAVAAGVGSVIVDSVAEIELLGEIAAAQGRVQPVLVRITTGIHAGGHEYISTAHEDQKFGLSIRPAPGEFDSPAMVALLKVLDQPSLRLRGFHSHIGSQILEEQGFKAAALALVKLRVELQRRRGFLVDEINLGGGFGIAYLPDEAAMDPRQAAIALATTIADGSRSLGVTPPEVAIEPGRSLIGPAGITLYTVGTIKPVTVTAMDGKVSTRWYVAVDGGLSDNIRPVLYGAQYHGELANRVSDAAAKNCRIVGKHCESGDILIGKIGMPEDIAGGDLLAVAATGAYGRSMASNYNMLLRPPVVAVAAGQATEIVRRETISDLLALDVGD
ncbi:MAG: diaminopimelate decarboxylase [Promicromonosporaceae bacterium]|nr:diaminopimelate decarboxylase [Promicromonosporaceae bacterium]